MLNTVLLGDAKELLKEIPSNSIDLVCTSPPYYNLRDYQNQGQIGNEDTPKQYIENLTAIMLECKRVIKKTGAIWVNIADTYASGGGIGNDQGFVRNSNRKNKPDLVNTNAKAKLRKSLGKSLLGIPEDFVVSMRDNVHLIRRNSIIWHKPSCMPSSVKDRFTIDFEYFYFFVKNNQVLLWKHRETKKWTSIKPKVDFTNPIQENIHWEWYENSKGQRIKRSLWDPYDYFFETQYEPYSETTLKEIMYEYNGKGVKDYAGNKVQDASKLKKRLCEKIKTKIVFGGNKYPNNQNVVINNTYSGKQWIADPNIGRIKRCVWSLNTANSVERHFATYPENLIEIPIKACTREGDVVLDPFAGSGTTLIKARKMGRKYIGIEINKDYYKIINRRLYGMLEAYCQ